MTVFGSDRCGTDVCMPVLGNLPGPDAVQRWVGFTVICSLFQLCTLNHLCNKHTAGSLRFNAGRCCASFLKIFSISKKDLNLNSCTGVQQFVNFEIELA